MDRLTVFTLSFISIALGFYILKSAESIVVPFAIAFSIAYIMISIGEGIGKLKVFGKNIPRFLSFLIAFLLIAAAIWGTSSVLSRNISALMRSAPVYQEKLKLLSYNFFDVIHQPVPDLSESLKGFDATSIMGRVLLFLKDIASGAGLIALYVIFILMEYHFFDKKVVALFRTKEGKASARKILRKIGKQIQSYIRIKTYLSLLTALISYVILALVGVDFAEFWAFSVFFLNYIPSIGSIIATILPCMLALIQFESWIPFAIVSCGLTSLHFLVGNVVEPKVMGKQFNLSGLVILVSLMVSFEVWGVAGMILSVPLLMIVSIILSNFPETRPIAVLLSQNGKIERRDLR